MAAWLQRAREKLGLKSVSGRPGLQDAIEWVLDNSSPKLRLIRGHKMNLAQPVESALNFIAQLIESIPGPLDVASDSAIDDVLVKSFFVDKHQFEDTLANDADIKNFLARKSTGDFFTLLTMHRDVKTMFGSRIQGETIERNVAFKAVNFSNHRFRVPSETMDDLKAAIERGVLQILAHEALESILKIQSRQEELSLLREELKVKLNILAHGKEQTVLDRCADSKIQPYRAAQKLLETTEGELKAIKSQWVDTNFHIEKVTRVLNQPGDFLTAESITLHFDRMGILLDEKTEEANGEVRVLDVRLGNRFHGSCVILKCSRNAFSLSPGVHRR